MKRTIICNIPMRSNLTPSVYAPMDMSLPASDRAVIYPINAYLEKILKNDDELKVILLLKNDNSDMHEENARAFLTEIHEINRNIGARICYVLVETAFSEEQAIHEELLGKIVDELEDGSHIVADITYGPKDLPIVLFSALNFAEKFLACEIDNIIYGQADFSEGKPKNTRICDMVPLYYLNSVTKTIVHTKKIKRRNTRMAGGNKSFLRLFVFESLW